MNRVVGFLAQTAAAGLLAFGLLSWTRPPALPAEPALPVLTAGTGSESIEIGIDKNST